MMAQLVYNRFRLTHAAASASAARRARPTRSSSRSPGTRRWTSIAEKFLALRDAGEARAIANKTSGRLPRGTGSLVGRFFTLLGSPNDTDVGPVCNDAGGDALGWTFGLGNFTNGYGVDGATGKEDLGSREVLPLPRHQPGRDAPGHLRLPAARAGRRPKAKLVVVDPRLHADRRPGRRVDRPQAAHRPGPGAGDAARTSSTSKLLRQGVRREVGARLRRTEEAPRREAGYTPEWAEGVTGVPAGDDPQTRRGVRRRRSRRRSSATPASRTSSARSTPTARSPSSRRSPATSASTAAAATSCTTPGPAA